MGGGGGGGGGEKTLGVPTLLSGIIARAIDVIMARAKRIYILMIKVNKLFPFFFLIIYISCSLSTN